MGKEEHAIILEYLPNGYPLEKKMMPIAQAIGESGLTLLELVPRRGESLEVGEKVYIGEGKRDKIYYILGRLKKEKITEQAKTQLEEFIKDVVKKREKEFVDFFNKSEAINKRIHQIELLPGLGKKHMMEILKQRKEKEFETFEEMKKRIQNLPDPEKAVERRILQELTNLERYNLFSGTRQ
jgi:putative nucleotide binding protein